MYPKSLRALAITAVLVATGPAIGSAMAQGFTPAPSQGFGAPPQQQQPRGPNPFDNPPPQRGANPFESPAQQGEPPCFKEFSALRGESEKRGKAIQAASNRKAGPPEACKLFNALMASEVKLIAYVEKNGKSCGMPPQVAGQLKANHDKVKGIRDRVCQVAAAGPARPAGPTLSDALGTSTLPDASNIKTGRGGGTFDTLTNTQPQR